MKRLLLGLAVCLAASIPAKAQPMRWQFRWWENPVTNGLSLSEAQQKQIQTTIREYRDKLRDLTAAVDKSESDLGDLLDAVPVDSRRANDAIEHVAAARADLTRTISQMSVRLRGVLTKEQWDQLRERQRNFGARGPGGPKRGPGPNGEDGSPPQGRRGGRRGPPPPRPDAPAGSNGSAPTQQLTK